MDVSGSVSTLAFQSLRTSLWSGTGGSGQAFSGRKPRVSIPSNRSMVWDTIPYLSLTPATLLRFNPFEQVYGLGLIEQREFIANLLNLRFNPFEQVYGLGLDGIVRQGRDDFGVSIPSNRSMVWDSRAVCFARGEPPWFQSLRTGLWSGTLSIIQGCFVGSQVGFNPFEQVYGLGQNPKRRERRPNLKGFQSLRTGLWSGTPP